MIETEQPGEEIPAQCTRSDEKASSIVLHVSERERERKDSEEANETAAAKRLRRYQKQRVKEVSKRKKNVRD